MEIQKKYKNLKVIITACLLILLGSFSYIYELTGTNERITKEKKISASKRSEVLMEFVKLNSLFTNMSIKYPILQTELEIEQQKLTKLIDSIGKTADDKISFKFYNKEINDFYYRISILEEIGKNNSKQSVIKNEDSIKTIKETKTDETKLKNINPEKKQVVVENKTEPIEKIVEKTTSEKQQVEKIINSKKIETSNILRLKNLKVETYSQKKSGELKLSDKINNIAVLKIQFDIEQTDATKQSNKSFYVQILDSKKNFVGEVTKKVFPTGEKLTFNLESNILLKNSITSVNENFKFNKFKEDNYTVKVFDKGRLLGQTTIELK